MKNITLTIIAATAFIHAALPAPIPYPKGVWAGFDVLDFGGIVPPGLANNKGLVGLAATDDWSEIQTGPETFDWSYLDKKIAAIKAAGFKYIVLGITASSARTPQWLLDSIPTEDIIYLRDPSETHKTLLRGDKDRRLLGSDLSCCQIELNQESRGEVCQ